MAAPPRQAPPPGSKRIAPPENPEREPELTIGDFRRGKEIGKGSFATVYLAQHRKKKSYAAVKVVHMSRLSSRLKNNLDSEIAILKDVQHPHVVALFSCLETPLYFYLVMEYCQLSDLNQFLKKRHHLAQLPETADIFRRYPNPPSGGFHEVLSRHFVKQIASALQYLRNSNFIHRDIKPQNILLNPAPLFMSKQRPEDVPLAASQHSLVPTVGVPSLPMIKIADFGFARHLPQASMAETLCGSPLYMAPEILRYEKYDARADLWSTGTVLYEMVVGKPPFRASNHVELLRRIEKANDQIPFDKSMSVSRGMKDLIRSLLRKSPLDRVMYEDFFNDPVITGEIPGLVEEDLAVARSKPSAEPQVSELSRRMAEQSIDTPSAAQRASPEPSSRSRPSQDEQTALPQRQSLDQDARQQPSDVSRRKTSVGAQDQPPAQAKEMQRRPSQREQPREQPQQRRPSMVTHTTAPARQELLAAQAPSSTSAPRMERRASRTSPLAGPPMVRESSSAARNQDHASRDAREQSAQDVAFEKEYVMVEKRAVEINAFADELDANRGSPQQHNPMVRRATTQGQPTPIAGVQPSSPSRAVQVAAGRPSTTHNRAGSFERKYAPSPQSATNMLSKALNAANVRLFGALGTSPPFSKGAASPPRGYSAFPAYPAQQAPGLPGEGDGHKTPMDEDTKILRTMEDAAHRSNVIWGFAEIKYRQLLPATPSTHDGLGIQQLGAADTTSAEEADKDMTTIAIVGVAEEALVLYVKTLSILAKTIDLAGSWWGRQQQLPPSKPQHITSHPADPSPRPTPAPAETGKRMNSVVQWARNRFNECLEKSEVVGRRLQAAQSALPNDHPGHPSNHTSASTSAGIAASTSHIQITTGVTAEKLMFERAVDMSRGAAVQELVGDDLPDCELNYGTAIMLLEGVLEGDDEPLMRKPSARKNEPGARVSGMETMEREQVVKVIEGARARLHTLRKKMHAPPAQQQQQQQGSGPRRRSSQSASGGQAVALAAAKPASSPGGLSVAGASPR